MKTCPSCGRENAADALFCSYCASALGEAAPAVREERKVVTVLFADLVGFTSRAEQMDPEDVRALLSRYHERVRAELERHGGTVEKFIGDAVMALFGAPVAHEDDPERAVRAALAIREAIAELNEQAPTRELHVRIGITTGEALVSLGARPEHGEGMAAGDVVNTAARLQAAAPTDGILVDETTYRATERVIDFRPHEPVDAKGKDEPVRVWEPLQARSRFGVDVRQQGRAPLVGRERELDVLVDALGRVKGERCTQLVTLVGVPGIGKSRLVYELFHEVDRSPDLVTWRQGRSLPYGEGVSFWALGEMVKAQAGILETDTAEETANKLSAAVSRLVRDESEARWVEGHLRPLVGLEAAAELGSDRRTEAFAAWRRFFEALGEDRPAVLVFEDLHFADDGVLDFVDHLVDWASGVALLVVGTARPELLTRRPGWGGGKPNATTLSLSRLSDDDTARLVHSLLERAVLPAELQQALLERAEGNPLYAEEFARLASEGRELEALPETVQGLIAARLDGLTAEEKDLVQNAAVLGKVFWLGALERMDGGQRWALEQRLHGLERKEFVRRERRSSVAGETEYAFRHLLVRDVAYGQIPRPGRAEKHRRVAEWLEALGRPDDHAEMLAHHYRAALDLAGAAGRDTSAIADRARHAFRHAGDRAFALNAFAAAAAFYADALELWPVDDPQRPEVLFAHAQALFGMGDAKEVEALEEAHAELIASGRREAAAEADALLADVWWQRGQRDRSVEHLERARTLVDEARPSRAAARVLNEIARRRMLAGDAGAAAIAEEALAMAETLELADVRAHALITIGVARFVGGEGGGTEVEQGLAIAEESNVLPAAVRGYNNLSHIASMTGDLHRWEELATKAIRVSQQLGLRYGVRFALGNTISAAFVLGRWDEALAAADGFIAECEAGSPHYHEAMMRTTRASIRLARDDTDGALDDVRRAIEAGRDVKDPQVLAPVLATAAEIYAELGRDGEASKLAREAVAAGAAREFVNLAWFAGAVGVADDLRNEIRKLLDRMVTPWPAAAQAALNGDPARAARIYEEIGAVTLEAYARLRNAEALAATGRRAEADAELRKAVAFYRSVGATRYVREAESLLAAAS